MRQVSQCVSVIEQALCSYEDILLEYCYLAAVPELSDSDADRLDKILTEAESDKVLNFLLNEIDYIVGQKLNLRDNVHVQKYKDQKAWLREHLRLLRPEELDIHRELQKLLQEKGYYKGPVDGVFGKEFHMAVQEFQISRALEADGVIGPKTILHLTSNSQTVVRLACLELELADLSPPGG